MRKVILILNILFAFSCKNEKTSLTELSSVQQENNKKEHIIKTDTIKNNQNSTPIINVIDYDKINKNDIIFHFENEDETITECVYSRNKKEFLENKHIVILFDKRIFMNINNQIQYFDLVTSGKKKPTYINKNYFLEINLKKTEETFEYAYIEVGELILKNTKNKILIKEKIIGIDTGY
jgi:hypothetical protein